MILSGKVCLSACSFLLVGDESLLLLLGLGFGGVVVGLKGGGVEGYSVGVHG